MPSSCCTVSNILLSGRLWFICNRAHYFHKLGELAMDAAIADRRYLAPAVASPNPPFLLGQCYTNLACEFDQTIIFRPTTPPKKEK